MMGMGNNQLIRNSAPIIPSEITIVGFLTSTAVPFPTVLTITYPTGLSSGDLLLLFISDANPNSTDIWTAVTMPSGWTLQMQYANTTYDAGFAIYSKIATGAESGTFTMACSAFKVASAIFHITGASSTAPIRSIGTVSVATANTLTVSGILTGDSSDVGFAIGSFDGGDGFPLTKSAGTNWVLQTTIRSGTSSISDTTLGVASALYSDNPTPAMTFKANGSTSDGFTGVQIRIKK